MAPVDSAGRDVGRMQGPGVKGASGGTEAGRVHAGPAENASDLRVRPHAKRREPMGARADFAGPLFGASSGGSPRGDEASKVRSMARRGKTTPAVEHRARQRGSNGVNREPRRGVVASRSVPRQRALIFDNESWVAYIGRNDRGCHPSGPSEGKSPMMGRTIADRREAQAA